MSYVPWISGFASFCEHHKDGSPIYLVCGSLRAGFDLLVDIKTRYRFTTPQVQKEIEAAIQKNLYMFDVIESPGFFYPNDNMFSGDNSQYHIHGLILRLKEKYQKQWS